MIKKLILFVTIISATLLTGPAQADPADISAASRSVVRVVLAAKDGNKVAFVGHGSGFAVAPDKIVTNAHVIEIARQEPSVVIGIIPSQGGKSYGGRVIAFSPDNDLALIQVLDGGRLPPMTIFGGNVADGADVVAIGYPGSVDRAQGLNLDDMITPMSPVKTRGSISGGRSTKQFDTILHTAPIASGNSGGPLIDNCGRILGANSFGSLSDGNDAEFGFAVSAKEILSFLRKAGVKVGATATPCRSAAEISREEQERENAERAKVEALEKAETAERGAKTEKLRTTVSQDIIAERENQMAIAALLLVLSLVAVSGGFYLMTQSKRNPAIAAFGGAAVLLLGAVIVFLSRPSFSEIEDRVALAMKEGSENQQQAITVASSGKYQCTINPDRSRITVSQQNELPLEWTDGGCVNGRTQYGRDGAKWSRIFVPNEEQTVTINSFQPDRSEFTEERYLLGLDAMTKARAIRQKYGNKACTADAKVLADVEDMVKAIRAELPGSVNERLVYECARVKD
ncbi:trypsin-like peptidase domain-containing protein [Parasphingorhabdus halotolerans]|uniref:Trypsin-like serine protease n=1 Tax=Parasphingorhabdus halotolerans TaxID=2725558 RepID=A0A6H2DJX9_9SPHN|nr:trypsin-like peptidase domain-containing protein [Parasphingorhabdus halotolerans]QJB68982.1 trypsin-like serine protease [Parasphingorhabdus halotolerans]